MLRRFLLAALFLVSPASAAEIRAYASLPIAPFTIPNHAAPFSVPGFDPALGTLHKVTIGLGAHESFEARAENQSPVGATLAWESAIGMRMAALDSTVLIDHACTPRIVGLRASPFDGGLDFAGTSGFTANLKSVVELPSAYVATAPHDLARFVGAGPRPFLIARTGRELFTSTSGNTTAGLSHRIGARLTILYEYTPAP